MTGKGTNRIIAVLLLAVCMAACAQHEKGITTTFSYDRPVGGYTVTGEFRPFDADCETGSVRMDFSKDGRRAFSWASEGVYCDYNTVSTVSSEGFQGWKNRGRYLFTYPDAPFDNPYYDDTHPLGYHQPFILMDIDFDGSDELLVSDYYRGQGGNLYEVYEIEGDGTRKVESAPFNAICNMTEIIPEREEIILWGCSGAYQSIFVSYRKGPVPPGKKLVLPEGFPQTDLDHLMDGSACAEGFHLHSVRLVCEGVEYGASLQDS